MLVWIQDFQAKLEESDKIVMVGQSDYRRCWVIIMASQGYFEYL